MSDSVSIQIPAIKHIWEDALYKSMHLFICSTFLNISIGKVDRVVITANFLFTYNSVALWTYVSYPGRCDVKLNLELGFSKGIYLYDVIKVKGEAM